jgi:tetratricopeptide (TPR) repeat protein
LIDARNDKHLWAQTFEGPLGDVLSLQDSVAREITSQTRTALTPAARAELTNAKPVNPEAHDAYLRGLYFINRREGVLAASYFQQAIALEPDYAAAQAGFAEAVATQFIASGGGAGAMPSAIAAAKRAIELDRNCGEAHTALGAIDVAFLWDWNAAEQNLRKGIALSPSSSHAQIWLAYLTEITRPAEAVKAMQRAVALDPLSFWANRHLGATLYYARRYDESLAALRRASDLAPDRPGFVGFWMSADYEMQGRYADAVESDLMELSPLSSADVDSLRSAFETGGWKGYQEARAKILLSRPSDSCEQWNNIALGYLRLGNMTEAFQWFNREVDRHCSWVLVVPSDPRLDHIRTDSHYTTLLSRINFPQQP